MDVACSTLCFSGMPLVAALRTMAELEFNGVDLAITDSKGHITVDELTRDPLSVINQLKLGPTLNYAALTLRTDRQGSELEKCVDAVAHFAKNIAAPILVLSAAPSQTPMPTEVDRLKRLVGVASRHGAVVTVATKTGTLTEHPETAVELCEKVEGLALTLDASHFICGPHQGKSFDIVYPFVHHTHLRDTGRRMDQLQVQVGRGEIDYGKIINSLFREAYHGSLTVCIEDALADDMNVLVEVRKLRLLLESYLIQRDTSFFRAAA